MNIRLEWLLKEMPEEQLLRVYKPSFGTERLIVNRVNGEGLKTYLKNWRYEKINKMWMNDGIIIIKLY